MNKKEKKADKNIVSLLAEYFRLHLETGSPGILEIGLFLHFQR